MKSETFKYLWDKGIVPAVKNVVSEIPDDEIEKFGVKIDVSEQALQKVYEKYDSLRKHVRTKYFNDADKGHKIDGHKICACITGALLQVKLVTFKMDDKNTPMAIALSNYAVAFLASNYVLYMFLLSDLERDGKIELYNKLKTQGTFIFPQTNKGHDPYVQGRIKTLALNDTYGNDFDILTYADMLFWIELYNIDRLKRIEYCVNGEFDY